MIKINRWIFVQYILILISNSMYFLNLDSRISEEFLKLHLQCKMKQNCIKKLQDYMKNGPTIYLEDKTEMAKSEKIANLKSYITSIFICSSPYHLCNLHSLLFSFLIFMNLIFGVLIYYERDDIQNIFVLCAF